MNKLSEDFLQSIGIRPTAMRILVWNVISHLDYAFSLSDVENILFNSDRSSIFRTLSLFVENGILHTIDDGSGMQKYCICSSIKDDYNSDNHHLDHHHSDNHHHCNHVHLCCTKCGKTFCLTHQEIPSVDIPKTFKFVRSSYIIYGICQHCDLGNDNLECCCHNQ